MLPLVLPGCSSQDVRVLLASSTPSTPRFRIASRLSFTSSALLSCAQRTTSAIVPPPAPAANRSGASSIRPWDVKKTTSPPPPAGGAAASTNHVAISHAPGHVVQLASGLHFADGRPVDSVDRRSRPCQPGRVGHPRRRGCLA